MGLGASLGAAPADRRRVLRHLADRPAGRADLREAGAGEAAGEPPTGARRWSATATRRAGCAAPRPPSRAAPPPCSARTRRAARWRCSSCRRTAIRCGRRELRDGPCRSRLRRRGRRQRSPASTPPPRPTRRSPPSSRPTTSSMTSGWSPTWSPPPPATPTAPPALRAIVARRPGTHKRALVHGDVSPKNILVGPRRPGVPGRRMRLVGRSGVRPRVLPEPPAAEMPVDAARAAPASWPASTALDAAYPARHRPGSRRAALRTRAPRGCCPGCCWRGWMASRRSNTSPRRRDKNRVRRVARALLAAPPSEPGDVRDGLAEGD